VGEVKKFGLWIMTYNMIKYFIHAALQKTPTSVISLIKQQIFGTHQRR